MILNVLTPDTKETHSLALLRDPNHDSEVCDIIGWKIVNVGKHLLYIRSLDKDCTVKLTTYHVYYIIEYRRPIVIQQHTLYM